MNLENLTDESIIELYFKLIDEKVDYESDITYTIDAIEDKTTDYMQRTELRQDLKYDKEQIEKITEQLNEIKLYAFNHGIELTRPNRLGM